VTSSAAPLTFLVLGKRGETVGENKDDMMGGEGWMSDRRRDREIGRQKAGDNRVLVREGGSERK
jgi:hypothetical protein